VTDRPTFSLNWWAVTIGTVLGTAHSAPRVPIDSTHPQDQCTDFMMSLNIAQRCHGIYTRMEDYGPREELIGF